MEALFRKHPAWLSPENFHVFFYIAKYLINNDIWTSKIKPDFMHGFF